MPHIDDDANEIVVRIVYDGIPEAGKTTNILKLSEEISSKRRSTVQNPGSLGERTAYFDWMDFFGGRVDGKRLRCQVVSVPGQVQLKPRREYILGTADVVVFVCDSRPELQESARLAYKDLMRILEGRTDHAPVGVVVQANKQDLSNALSVSAIRENLASSIESAVIPSSASTGQGVMHTFMLAVRLASDCVRASVGSGDGAPPLLSDSSTLFEALKGLDNSIVDFSRSIRSHLPDFAPTPRNGPPATSLAELEVPHSKPDNRMPRLPESTHVEAGYCWPPVSGRSILSRVEASVFVPSQTPVSWAPEGAREWKSDTGFLVHTCSEWTAPEKSDIRVYLHRLVRQIVDSPLPSPRGRALICAPDGDAWRIWSISPGLVPLTKQLQADGNSLPRLARALEDEFKTLQARYHVLDNPPAFQPEDLSIQDNRMVRLSLRNPRHGPGDSTKALALLADRVNAVLPVGLRSTGLAGLLEQLRLA